MSRRAWGSGAVCYRPERTRSPWGATVGVGYTPKGKRRRATRWYQTRDEAEAALVEMLAGEIRPAKPRKLLPTASDWTSQKHRPKNAAIPAKVRFLVLERDGFTCRYCGARPPDTTLHVDHIIPKSKGGSNLPDNLVTACRACNLGKGAR